MTDNAAVAKSVNIEELFKIMDQMLPPIPSPHFEDAIYQDPVEAIYNTIYAAALDKFLETRWYTTSGLNALRRDAQLFAEFVAFFRAASLRPEEPSPPNLLAQETRLIWNLLNMCCTSKATIQEPNDFNTDMVELMNEGSGMSTDPAKPYQNDAPSTNIGNRKSVINSTSQQLPDTQSDTTSESILTTTTTTTNLASSDSTASIPSARLTALTALLTSSSPRQPPNPPPTPVFNSAGTESHPALSPLSRQLQTRSNEFWSSVEKYASAAADAEKKAALQTARALLDGFENRDVVYTIMRMTWLQSTLPPKSPRAEPLEPGVKETEEDDEKEIEEQAQAHMDRGRRFCIRVLENEAGLADGGDGVHSGIGKNLVAMRIAGMAVRAFGS
jgi:hypothetical protein